MIIKYSIAVVIFFIIDIIWLGFLAKGFYQNQIGDLMKENINWFAAIALYLVLNLGLIVFVVNPALEKGSWLTALLLGGLFGLVTYATYDLTNLAVIKNWNLTVTGVDILWGAVICSTVSVLTYFSVIKFGI